ncbi:hypothetical protein DD595_26400, partial [Enterobacter cloacae complex sp. 4DZ3-17B2]|uniref:hypothetical protein n=1 Tax=Enterobacter cloacae complex sp. 4DZ3-17B2 TaxID=2511990 RepID=UPI001026E82E
AVEAESAEEAMRSYQEPPPPEGTLIPEVAYKKSRKLRTKSPPKIAAIEESKDDFVSVVLKELAALRA